MLQRLNFSLGEVPIDGDGIWTRARLEEMDAAFTGAVLRAFELKLESRSAAAATVSFRNGKTAAIESAIEAAWDLLCSREGEILFGEIVSTHSFNLMDREPLGSGAWWPFRSFIS